ncbi:hypothetical protein [Cohnella zeiphila]
MAKSVLREEKTREQALQGDGDCVREQALASHLRHLEKRPAL